MNDTLLLRDKDKLQLLQLLIKYLPNVTAWAYGSRVNGNAHDTSDLDLVLRTPDLSPIPILALEDFLEAIQNSTIPILIEARDWARLPNSFQQEILKNYVVLKTNDVANKEETKENLKQAIELMVQDRMDDYQFLI